MFTANAKLRSGLLSGAALIGLLAMPGAANASCTIMPTGAIDCGTTTTVDVEDDNGAVSPTTDNHLTFNTGVAVNVVIDPGATIDGWGLWISQDAAAPQAISIINNGNFVTAQPTQAIEIEGNGGLITYSGNGSASQTNTSQLFAGVSLFNRNNGGVDVGTALNPITGNFLGGDGFYVGVPAGSPDIFNGAQNLYFSGGSFTSIEDGDTALFGDARSGAGDVFIDVIGNSIVTATTTGAGISAHSGSGSATVISDADVGTAGANVGIGVRVSTNAGSADVSLTEDGGAIFADQSGLLGTSGGSGSVTVAVSGATQITANTAAANGIFTIAVDGTTTVGITGTGTSVAAPTGWGITLDSTTGDMNASIAAGNTVSGGLSAFQVATTSGLMTLDNAGTINTGPLTASLSAIVQTGGSVLLNNSGTIAGGIHLSHTTGANTINNAGQWTITGANSFGPAADAFDNMASGRFTVSGCAAGCAFTFAGAGTDTLSNEGTLTLGTASTDSVSFTLSSGAANAMTNTGLIQVAGSAAFNGLAAFNNAGGALDMRQAVTGNANTDSVTVSGAFNGGAGSVLGVNAYLGGAGSTADMLHVGGAVTGTTAIAVADTNPGLGGFTGAGGIPLVTVVGASSADAFVLSPSSTVIGGGYETVNGTGVLQKGAFDYYLANPAPGSFALVSAPAPVAVQAPIAITGAQTIWYETALGWQDRVVGSQPQADSASFWLTPVGSWTDRSGHRLFTVAGQTVDYDLGYEQDVWGLLGGYEKTFADVGAAGASLKLGAMAGYVAAGLDFDKSNIGGVAPSTFRYSGGILGATATYRSGAFFLDGLAKVDLLRIRMSQLPDGAGGFKSASVNSTTWGAMGSAGYRFEAGGVFIDPMVTLAGTSSHIDSLAIPAAATTLKFDDDDTFRGAVGARIGGVLQETSAGDLVGSLTGRVWDQFSGNTATVVVANIGSPLDLTDHFDGTFGEVAGRLDWTGMLGALSSYLQAGVKFNSQFTTTSIAAGLRWNW